MMEANFSQPASPPPNDIDESLLITGPATPWIAPPTEEEEEDVAQQQQQHGANKIRAQLPSQFVPPPPQGMFNAQRYRNPSPASHHYRGGHGANTRFQRPHQQQRPFDAPLASAVNSMAYFDQVRARMQMQYRNTGVPQFGADQHHMFMHRAERPMLPPQHPMGMPSMYGAFPQQRPVHPRFANHQNQYSGSMQAFERPMAGNPAYAMPTAIGAPPQLRPSFPAPTSTITSSQVSNSQHQQRHPEPYNMVAQQPYLQQPPVIATSAANHQSTNLPTNPLTQALRESNIIDPSSSVVTTESIPLQPPSSSGKLGGVEPTNVSQTKEDEVVILASSSTIVNPEASSTQRLRTGLSAIKNALLKTRLKTEPVSSPPPTITNAVTVEDDDDITFVGIVQSQPSMPIIEAKVKEEQEELVEQAPSTIERLFKYRQHGLLVMGSASRTEVYAIIVYLPTPDNRNVEFQLILLKSWSKFNGLSPDVFKVMTYMKASTKGEVTTFFMPVFESVDHQEINCSSVTTLKELDAFLQSPDKSLGVIMKLKHFEEMVLPYEKAHFESCISRWTALFEPDKPSILNTFAEKYLSRPKRSVQFFWKALNVNFKVQEDRILPWIAIELNNAFVFVSHKQPCFHRLSFLTSLTFGHQNVLAHSIGPANVRVSIMTTEGGPTVVIPGWNASDCKTNVINCIQANESFIVFKDRWEEDKMAERLPRFLVESKDGQGRNFSMVRRIRATAQAIFRDQHLNLRRFLVVYFDSWSANLGNYLNPRSDDEMEGCSSDILLLDKEVLDSTKFQQEWKTAKSARLVKIGCFWTATIGSHDFRLIPALYSKSRGNDANLARECLLNNKMLLTNDAFLSGACFTPQKVFAFWSCCFGGGGVWKITDFHPEHDLKKVAPLHKAVWNTSNVVRKKSVERSSSVSSGSSSPLPQPSAPKRKKDFEKRERRGVKPREMHEKIRKLMGIFACGRQEATPPSRKRVVSPSRSSDKSRKESSSPKKKPRLDTTTESSCSEEPVNQISQCSQQKAPTVFQYTGGKRVPVYPNISVEDKSKCLTCSHCSRTFPTFAQFKKSCLLSCYNGNESEAFSNQPTIIPVDCSICDQIVEGVYAYLEHFDSHEFSSNEKCSQCSKSCSSIGDLYGHDCSTSGNYTKYSVQKIAPPMVQIPVESTVFVNQTKIERIEPPSPISAESQKLGVIELQTVGIYEDISSSDQEDDSEDATQITSVDTDIKEESVELEDLQLPPAVEEDPPCAKSTLLGLPVKEEVAQVVIRGREKAAADEALDALLTAQNCKTAKAILNHEHDLSPFLVPKIPRYCCSTKPDDIKLWLTPYEAVKQPEAGFYTCNICQQSFPKEAEYSEHFQHNHRGLRLTEGSTFNKVSPVSPPIAAGEQRITPTTMEEFFCQECSQTFTSTGLEEHLKATSHVEIIPL